jgi:hypothetical protein
VARRFAKASFAFVSLILLMTFTLALLMAPARPSTLDPPGCDRNLAEATANIQAMQARVKSLGPNGGQASCTAARLYFLELVKTRAITALCKLGPDRDRELGRLDADVEQMNGTIATSCR